MDINPLDTRLIDRINDLEGRLVNLENTRQPYISDWRSMNPTDFSYSKNNKINVAFNPTATFMIGDKIKLKQGSTKYFYVTRVKSTYIQVNAGGDYTYTNSTITSFEYSKLGSPSGFPQAFNFTPTITFLNGSGNSMVQNSFDYSIDGGRMFFRGLYQQTFTTEPTWIRVSLPYDIDATPALLYEHVAQVRGINGTTWARVFKTTAYAEIVSGTLGSGTFKEWIYPFFSALREAKEL